MEKVCKVKKGVQSKSVQSVYVLQENDRIILQNLYQNREGLRAITLQKLTGLKTRTIYKRLNLLRDKGLIENIFPIWKIVNGKVDFCSKLLKSDDIFELHNLSYILRLVKVPDWWNKRKPRLQKLKGWQFSNHNFGKNNSNPFQQLINENFVVQTYPESIIIIHRKRYYSNNPYEVIQQGMNDVLDLIRYLEERFRFKFFPDGIPSLELRANDFNRLKDHLANFCKKEGRRFLVETEKGKVWVDYSEPFGKEANTPDIQDTLERHTKDLILNKPMTNSELQFAIQQVTQNQLMFNENFESHVQAVKKLGNSADANAKTTELLAEVIKDLMAEVRNLREEVKQLKDTRDRSAKWQ